MAKFGRDYYRRLQNPAHHLLDEYMYTLAEVVGLEPLSGRPNGAFMHVM